MPELPEVQTIVNELIPIFEGKTLKSVTVLEKRSIDREPEAFTNALENSRIIRIFRRGKYLCFTQENGSHLTIHLRMTGKLLQHPAEKDKKYIRVKFAFEENFNLYFVDVRKFGHMKLWPAGDDLLPKLGPEPLKSQVILDTLRSLNSTRFIKTILLDQYVLAGVGNIYADEALFAAGISPQARLREIKASALKKLSRELPRILKEAMNNKGTTLSDYRTPDSQSGNHQNFLKVYGRTNLPCYTCETPVKRIVLHGRSSHFCPTCQNTTVQNKYE